LLVLFSSAVLLHQIYRAVGKLKKMWVRAIAVGQNCKTEFAIAVAEQKGSIAGNAAAVRNVAIAITNLRPPRQSKSGGLVSPAAFNRSFELIVLARKHLFHRLLADQSFAFVNAAVEICNQPVR